MYSINLLKNHKKNAAIEQPGITSAESKPPIKQRLMGFFQDFIYKWDENFRYSSRIISTHIVAYITLYYFFLTWLYYGIQYINSLVNKISTKFFDLILFFDVADADINLPSMLIKPGYIAAFIVPTVLSFIICIIQVFFGLRNIKTSLLKMYKGDYDGVPLKVDLSHLSISSGNIHFSGFLVGYLIWGFLFIFAFLFAIAVLFVLMDQIITGQQVLDAFLFILPFLLIFIIKFIGNLIFSRFVFLQEYGKLLALNNSRLYIFYLYFVFFFDCFFGVVSAIIRIIKSLIASIFFMPRISYPFTGRPLENIDSGFQCFVGYLYMELCK